MSPNELQKVKVIYPEVSSLVKVCFVGNDFWKEVSGKDVQVVKNGSNPDHFADS